MIKPTNNKLMKICLVKIIIFLFPVRIFAQESAFNASQSMGTGSSGNSENSTVNMSTGTVSTSIPLGVLVSGGYSLPISLNYSSTGIRVEQDADWVGLGWSLFTGGQIAWNVIGIRDDAPASNLPERPQGEAYNDNGGYWESMNDPISKYGSRNVYENKLDYQPDEFYFSTPRNSGMFVIKKTGFVSNNNALTPILIPFQNLKVEKIGNYSVGSPFRITDDQGYKYTYDTHQGVLATSVSSESNYENIPLNFGGDYETIKFLDKIEDYNNIELFRFEYSNNPSQSANVTNSESGIYRDGLHVQEFITTNSAYTLKQITKRISKIVYENGYVTFEKNTIRQDIPNETSLKSISFYNINDILIKKINFEYTYFTNILNDIKKLRLDKIWEEDSKGAALNPYIFEYDNRLPTNTKDQDHWGYYNGANNPNLIPVNHYTKNLHQNANREPNSNYTQAGILNKIINPNGGSKQFVYENNHYGRYNNVEVNSNKLQKHSELIHLDWGASTSSYQLLDGYAYYPYLLTLDHTQNIKISGSSTYEPNNRGQVFILEDDGLLPLAPPLNGQMNFNLISGVNTFNRLIPLYGSTSKYLWLVRPYIGSSIQGNLQLNLEYTTLTGEIEKSTLASGLRIKKIITDDGDGDASNNIVQYYKYNMADPNNIADQDRSSGYLLNLPKYDYVQQTECEDCDQDHYVRGTNSQTQNQALIDKDGIVAYEYITMYDCDLDIFPSCSTNTGKIIYQYEYYPPEATNAENYLLPNSSKDLHWRRNLLKSTSVIKGDGSPLSKSLNSYAFSIINSVVGVKFRLNEYFINSDKKFTEMKFGDTGASWLEYTYNSEWIKQIGESITNYENGTGLITTKEIFYSDVHKKPGEIRTFFPDQSRTIQLIKYIDDFATSGATYGTDKSLLQKLKDKNIKSLQIYNATRYLAPNGAEFYYTTANFTKFGFFNNNNVDYYLPKESFALETFKPLENILLPYLDINTQNFAFDTRIKLKSKINSYYFTPRAILPQVMEDELGLKKRVIYNSKLNTPVAKISFQESEFAAYTSYEFGDIVYLESEANTEKISANSQTTPTSAVTGLNYLKILANKTVSYVMLQGTYIVSFWSDVNPIITLDNISILKTTQDETTRPNGWQYNEYLIQANSSIELYNKFTIGNGTSTLAIDELRLYPKNATMNSTCYNATGQVISTCDINNNIVHTQYDSFNRIKCTKDRNGNIIKKYNYDHGDSDLFFNVEISRYIDPHICPTGQSFLSSLDGSYPAPVIIPAGSINSEFSKSEANYLAEEFFSSNYQIIYEENNCVTPEVCNSMESYKDFGVICKQGVKEYIWGFDCECVDDYVRQYYRYSFWDGIEYSDDYPGECYYAPDMCN